MNRMIFHRVFSCLLLSSLLTGGPSRADSVSLPHTFAAGTPAVAAEVNANFDAVKTAVDDNDARVSQLEAEIVDKDAEIAALDSRIDILEAFIAELQTAMTLQTDAQGHPAVVFSGVNVHINNGAGGSETINGRGNLIVGYDEPRSVVAILSCSQGQYETEPDCETNGGAWALSYKSGSHNLVVGRGHNYSRYGGFVTGFENIINGFNASVSGGANNWASGASSSVSGGVNNKATGDFSSVSGGDTNMAGGQNSSVSGGWQNTASGQYSSVSGGYTNMATGDRSSVSGGFNNTTSALSSSIGGGQDNTASGDYSSVSGGNGGTASGTDDWVAGSLFEEN